MKWNKNWNQRDDNDNNNDERESERERKNRIVAVKFIKIYLRDSDAATRINNINNE